MFNRKSYFICVILFAFIVQGKVGAQSTAMDIKVEVENYPSDTLFLGNYFGKGKFFYDTAVSQSGKFRFQIDSLAPAGVYILLDQSAKHFVELILEDDQVFEVKLDSSFALENMEIKGEAQNKAFYDYIDFIKEMQPKANKLRQSENIEDQKKLEAINDKVAQKQQDIVESFPDAVIAALIKNTMQIDVPEFEDAENPRLERYNYYKAHYFDNVDLTDGRALRYPFFYNKVDQYLTKIVSQHPDSIAKGLDRVLKPMLESGEKKLFQYYLANYLTKFAKSKIVGHDGVYVHLVNNYYKEGHADWLNEEQLDKIIKEAKKIEPTLIGKQAPEVILKDVVDLKPFNFYDLNSEYTILMFWAPDCSHCKKSMPDVIEFYNEYKDKDISFVAICTKLNQDAQHECKTFIDKRENMDLFINVFDPYLRSRYKQKYNVVGTPKIFILNKEKEIIMKNIGTEKLKEVMDNIMEVDSQKNK